MFFRRKKFIAILLMMLFVGWHYWSFLLPKWFQDGCSYGSEPNERYIEKYEELRLKAQNVLAHIQANNIQMSGYPPSNTHPILKPYIDEAVSRAQSRDETLLGLHAASRALGAWYVDTYTRRVEGDSSKHTHTHVYGISVWRVAKIEYHGTGSLLGILFAILFPWSDLVIMTEVSSEGEVVKNVSIRRNPFKGSRPVSMRLSPGICPQ